MKKTNKVSGKESHEDDIKKIAIRVCEILAIAPEFHIHCSPSIRQYTYELCMALRARIIEEGIIEALLSPGEIKQND